MKKSLLAALALSMVASFALANTPKALQTNSTNVKTQKECCFKCCGIHPLSPKK